MSTQVGVPRRGSRFWRWLLLVVAGLVALALGALWYVSLRIPRVEGELPSLDIAQTGRPRNFLIVGSDSRERLPEDFPDFFGEAAGQRSDVLMLVHMVPGQVRAQILSLPRDLKVEIPGRGTDKVNAALAYGGPDLMVQTVKAFTGLPVHHYLQLDFGGFAEIVDALGGVDLYFPFPARDAKSGLQVEAGQNRLDGGMALAYVRSRQYEEHREGRWVSVEGGDLGRIDRQQRLMFAILAEAKDPSTLLEAGGLTSALGTHLTADRRFGVLAMGGIAWRLPFLESEDVEATALPVETSNEGGVAYVVPVEPEAQAVLDAFRSGTSMLVAAEGPPRLHVLNGNGVEGSAGRTADRLGGEGYPIVGVGDADRSDYPTTLLVARPEDLERAELVAGALGFGRVVAGQVPSDVDVLVIVGLDATG